MVEDSVVYHAYSTYAHGLGDGPLVAPPRRVQQGLSEVVVDVAQNQHGYETYENSMLLFEGSCYFYRDWVR